MKKFIALIILLLISISIIGCSNQSKPLDYSDNYKTQPIKPIDENTVVAPIATISENKHIIPEENSINENLNTYNSSINNIQNETNSTILGSTKNGCFDSENGRNYELNGYIIDTEGRRFDDYCTKDTNLNEVYCGLIGYKETELIYCEYGCKDGACQKPTQEQICVDTDNGKKPELKGVVSYHNKSYEDLCVNNNWVNENYCSSVGVPSKEEIYCKNGCVNGACVVIINNPQDSCYDSDNGSDEKFTKGITKDIKGEISDSCMNSFTVKEWKCNSIGYKVLVNIICPDNGKCVDGACIK